MKPVVADIAGSAFALNSNLTHNDDVLRAARKPFGIDSLETAGQICPVEETTPLVLPYAALTKFSRRDATDENLSGETFFVVPPLAGAYPVLMRDLVIALLGHAKNVAVADWLDPRFVPLDAGRFGFSENITSLVAMLRALGPETHVVAVCQAGSPALAATAMLAAEDARIAPLSLTLLGCPIDPAANMTGLAHVLETRPLDWLRDHLIEPAPEGFPGSGRRVYARERQLQGFLSYLQRHIARQDELFWKLMLDDGAAPFQFPFWTLISTLMDLTEEFVLEDIQAIFHERALVRGALVVGDVQVEPRAIVETAVLTIEGCDDDLAPPGQTRAALDWIGPAAAARRRHVSIEKCGHFSLFHGQVCRKRVVPEIVSLAESCRSP